MPNDAWQEKEIREDCSAHGYDGKCSRVTRTPKQIERTCGRCGKSFPEFPALSRADNDTELCFNCGTAEAFDCMQLQSEGKTRDEVITYLRSRLF